MIQFICSVGCAAALVGISSGSGGANTIVPEKNSTSYRLDDKILLKSAEKILYKKTSQEDLYLYLLRPSQKTTRPLPAIVYFTGGGWEQGEPTGMIANAAWFRDVGFIGIAADYRVRSRHGTTPLECVKDAKSAVRFVRANAEKLGVDPNAIVAAGGSAGGHLAAACVLEGHDESDENLKISSRPNAIVMHNPVLGKGFGEWFFKEHPECSPLNGVRKGWPPTVLSCGTKDNTTPHAVAVEFTEKMNASGNRCELITVDGAEHSCDWPVTNPAFVPTMMRMTEFLVQQGFNPLPPKRTIKKQ